MSAPRDEPTEILLIHAFQQIQRNEFILNNILGEGAFASVHQGSWKNEPVAVKVVRFHGSPENKQKIKDIFYADLEVLSKLRHPRVVTLLGACLEMPQSEGNGAALIMELMERGSLDVLLHSSPASEYRPSSDLARLRCALDIAEGMRFLHSCRLIHRDLKSGNVLVDGEGRCKICDFGLSRFRGTLSHVSGVIGTVAWTAPEILSDPDEPSKDSVVSQQSLNLIQLSCYECF